MPALHLNDLDWRKKVVTPETVLDQLKPGMRIFLGTGSAEPRTLAKQLFQKGKPNLIDMDIIQLISTGEALTHCSNGGGGRYRMKTFFTGWQVNDAIDKGHIDLIPGTFTDIPGMIEHGALGADVAFIQITAPASGGFVSMGISADVTRQIMSRASLIVGEITPSLPRTMGAVTAHVSEFDYLIHSMDGLTVSPRLTPDPSFTRIAANIASFIEDGSCLNFYPGMIYEALCGQLKNKKNLGVHSTYFTDALMDLVKSGTVNNSLKGSFRGKSTAVYAQGTRELMKWLDDNPLVEFHPIDVVSDINQISRNDKMIAIIPARKVDITGIVALHKGRDNIVATPGQVQDIFNRIERSPGARKIFALPSRNLRGEPNIRFSVTACENLFTNRESLDLIVTENGAASLRGRSLRERAQAIIDIAHREDRQDLIRQAKEARILYPDQICLFPDACPEHQITSCTFGGNVNIHFRSIKPSDEEEMRRLFYRLSSMSVYYRYHYHINAMPHKSMQQYVNIDYNRCCSVVGLLVKNGMERIVAEGRYAIEDECPHVANLAVFVDEQYQGMGIATYLLDMLSRMSHNRGIKILIADIMAENKAIMKVMNKLPYSVKTTYEQGVYSVKINIE